MNYSKTLKLTSSFIAAVSILLMAAVLFFLSSSLTKAQTQSQQTQQNNPNAQQSQAERTPTQTPSSTSGVGVGTTRAVSNTCTTKIGQPTDTDKKEGCDASGAGGSNPGLGNYSFPLNPTFVTSINTEMAAYAQGGSFGGHREHAGLDINAPNGEHIPVYSVADGVVQAIRESCYPPNDYSCRLDIANAGDNFISSYSHIDVPHSIGVGTSVKKGQQIGVVHAWNNDHLHFEFLDKTKKDNLGVGWNINPRNYFPELQRWPPFPYGGTGASVRAYTNSQGINWANDGKEYAETFLNHPPCPGDCWAH